VACVLVGEKPDASWCRWAVPGLPLVCLRERCEAWPALLRHRVWKSRPAHPLRVSATAAAGAVSSSLQAVTRLGMLLLWFRMKIWIQLAAGPVKEVVRKGKWSWSCQAGHCKQRYWACNRTSPYVYIGMWVRLLLYRERYENGSIFLYRKMNKDCKLVFPLMWNTFPYWAADLADHDSGAASQVSGCLYCCFQHEIRSAEF